MRCLKLSFFLLLLIAVFGLSRCEETPWNVTCPAGCTCTITESVRLYRNMKTVNCAFQEKAVVPEGIPWDSEVLIARGNYIRNVSVLLTKLTQMKELDLSQNNVTLSRRDAFQNLHDVEFLDLNNNKINTLRRGTFRECENLRDLLISYNKVKVIEDGAFERLVSLERLTLTDNEIDWLNPEWFKDLHSLTTLLLSNNKLVRIKDQVFLNLRNLNRLSLSGNRIQRIENKGFAGLPNLKFLYLDENKLEDVPGIALEALSKINVITFDKNPMRQIKPFAFQKLQVAELNLNEMPLLNEIHKDAFINLDKLVILQMHDNPNLVYINPEAFRLIGNLSNLFIHNNKLIGLEQLMFRTLPSLSLVSFYGNPVRCDCSALWLSLLLHDNKTSNLFMEPNRIVCETPMRYKSRTLYELRSNEDIASVCAPYIVPMFNKTFNIRLGDRLELPCHAFGFPKSEIHWLKPDGSIIDSSVVKGRIKVKSDSTLVIQSAESKDRGTYTCVAVNSEGSDTKSAHVAIKNINVQIFPLGVSATFITVVWNGTDALSIPRYQIMHRMSPTSNSLNGSEKFHAAPISIPMRRYTIDHLVPNTDYEICISYQQNNFNIKIACTKVRTKDVDFLMSGIRRTSNVAVGITLGIVVVMICFICLTTCAAKKYRQRKYFDPAVSYVDTMSNIPLENLYSPLMSNINA